jgi:chromosome segregation ATPase
MARALITFEDFKRSWMRITSKGKHASLDAIYEDLGRQGSKSTLQKYRTRLLEELSSKGAEILPATIPRDMVPLIEEFFTKSVAIAGEIYQSHKKELERRLESAFTERAEFEADLKESERIRKEQANLIESLQNDKEMLQASLDTKYNQVVALSEKKSTLEEQLESQKALHNAELQRLHQDAEAIEKDRQTRFDALKRQAEDEAKRADTAIQQADKNADHFLLQIADERDKSARIEDNLQTNIKRLESQLHISQKREDGLAVKLGKTEERLLSLQDSFESLKQSNSAQIHALTIELSDRTSDIKWLERQKAESQDERKELVKELSRLKDKAGGSEGAPVVVQ